MTSFSVVIPTLNGGPFIGRQVRSILEQRSLPLELIVTDDGSTDDTLAEVTKAINRAARGDEVRVLIDAHERLGLLRNLERALSAATGDVVVFADQDDVWEPHKLEILDADFANCNCRAVFSNGNVIDEHGAPTGKDLWQRVGLTNNDLERIRRGRGLDVLVRGNFVTGATMACRSDLVSLAVPFPDGVPHDAWMALLACSLGGLVAEPDRLIRYRVHSGNTIGLPPKFIGAVHQRIDGSPRSIDEAMFRAACDRLAGLVDRSTLERLRAKGEFASARRRLPTGPASRVRKILALAGRGDYQAFCTNPSRSIAHDLLRGPQ